MIDGIVKEHKKSIKSEQNKEFELDHIELLWYSFVRAAGVGDLKKVPNTSDPKHAHVKIILLIYSMECFLFKKLNRASRDKD